MSSAMQRLRDRLAATGKTQVQIEEATGVSQTTISRIFNLSGTLRMDTAEKLEGWLATQEKPKRKRKAKEAAQASQ